MSRHQAVTLLSVILAVILAPSLIADSGLIATIAGGGNGGVGGPAASALLTGPFGIAIDSADNLYISDSGSNRVVRVDAVTGILTLVAGNGAAAFGGDGGPAALASINHPYGVAIDAAGNLFIAEFPSHRIRRVDAQTGIITTAAGNGTGAFSGDGGPASSAGLRYPMSVALDSAGNLFIADSGNARIRRVDAQSGMIATVAGNGSVGVTADGALATAASFSQPLGLSVDRSGNLLIGEIGSASIRRVDAVTGILSTFAGNGSAGFTGDGVPATSAGIGKNPANVAIDSAGNYFFADGTGRIRRVDGATGMITTVAGNGSGAQSQQSVAAGGGGGSGGGSSCYTTPLGDNGPASVATLDGPLGVVLTRNGNLIFSDWIDCRVRRVYLPSPSPYTNTSVTASAASVGQGQTVTFTATVTPIDASGIPSGSITFVDAPLFLGVTVLGTAQMTNGGATLSAPAPQAQGSHQIVAYYSGDGLFNGSGSPALPLTVTYVAHPAVTVKLTSSQNPVLPNTPVTFTITVTPPAGSTAQPTGTVVLWDGPTQIGNTALVNGAMQFTAPFTTTGIHNLNAIYVGDSNYTYMSSPTLNQMVTGTSSTILNSSPNPSATGGWVTFTAFVLPAAATGTIQFVDGATTLGTGTLGNGVAFFSTPNLTTGFHSVQAVYAGDGALSGSTSPVLNQSVLVPATTTLSSSAVPSTYGQPIILTATVAPATATGRVQFLDGGISIGTPGISGGMAVVGISSLAAGIHNIVAAYSGDGTHGASVSAALAQGVAKATPAITVTSNMNPAVSPAAVSFVANISPVSPGATVQFLDGQTVIGTAVLSAGPVSMSTAALTPGTHSIMVVCPGDANLNPAASATLVQTIQAPATIGVTSAGASTVYGQAVAFTATLSPAAATGTVQFADGPVTLGTATIANGTAVFTAPALSAGNHPILATYNGDGIYIASSSTVWLQTVNKATAVAALTSSLNPANTGQAVTFNASVSPGTATGSVQFLDGATVLGTTALIGGAAALSTSALAGGSHPITAVYAGDGNFSGATTPGVAQVVKIVTTTSVAGAGTSSYGQAVQFVVSVSPSDATGTVQFLDGAASLGSATVSAGAATLSVPTFAVGTHAITASYSGDSGYAGSTSAVVTQTVQKAGTTVPTFGTSANPSIVGQNISLGAAVSAGTATGTLQFLDGGTVLGTVAMTNGSAALFTSTLGAGSHSLTAVYSGDANFNGSTSAVVVQIVKTASSSTVGADSVSPVFGQTVNLQAWVTPTTATGTFQFLDGTTPLGTVTVNGGSATLPIASLSTGSHAIWAAYSGDGSFGNSTSPTMTYTVGKANPGATATSSPNPSNAGQAVTLTAMVSPSSATGTVQFLDGSTVLATATLSGGSATVTTSALGGGSHTITAAYSGDGNYNSLSSAIVQTVKAGTVTSVISNNASVAFGQAIQFTASVTPGAATGSVQFLDGAVTLGTATVSGGTAALSVSTLPVGSHSITVAYSGDGSNAAATSAVWTQTVVKAATTAGLSGSPNPSLGGQSVTLTATVSPAGATGSVQFLDGSTPLGTVALSGGVAGLSTSTLAAGGHSITAVYSGDATYAASTSAAMPQVVRGTTTVSLGAGPNPSAPGQSVTLTVVVSPSAANGTVQFLDGGTSLGTVSIGGGTAGLAVGTLALGAHSITAVYSGDATYSGAASGALTQTVVKAASTVSLSAGPNPSAPGQSVTLTAVVWPSTATGTVQFQDGSTTLGTASIAGGAASLAVGTLAVGTHSITAYYSGDATYSGATSGASTQTVARGASTITLSASPDPSVYGQSVSFTAAVSPAAATGSVQFFDGGTSLGTAPIGGGRASLAVPTLSVGSHSVTAVWGGDANYVGSTSASVTQAVTPALPGAPASLTATAISSSQINLSWTTSPTSGVTYNVYSGNAPGFGPSAGNRIASGLTTSTYFNTGLAPSTARFYLVTAQNSAGESASTNLAGATTQAGVGCHVVYTVTTQWNVGFGTAITIKNTGLTPINGWQLTWTWAANQQITQSWNSNFSQTGANAKLTNAGWNPFIPPGATVAGMGFNASYSGPNAAPAAFYVNGTRCQ